MLKVSKTEHPCFEYTILFFSLAVRIQIHCSRHLSLFLRPHTGAKNNLLTFCWLTVGMLVGQPMVFGTLELKVGVAELALLGSEIFEVLGAVVSVAKLILVVYSWAVLATVGGSGERKMDKHQRS